MDEVRFTAHECRVLELPQDINDKPVSPVEWQTIRALRKTIDSFPWIVDVADYNFDPLIVSAAIVSQAQIVGAKEFFDRAVEEYKRKRGGG